MTFDSIPITEVRVHAVLVDTNGKKRWCTRMYDNEEHWVLLGYKCILTGRKFFHQQCNEIREGVIRLGVTEDG